MICGQCFNPIVQYRWYNNVKMCESCIHKAQPWKKKNCDSASCRKPTIQDLKKKWEKKS